MEKGEVAQNEQFWFIPQCFHAICTLKSFNSHISVVVCNFFEFGTVSKCNACHGAAARSLLLQYGWYPEINRILKAHTKSLHRLCTISKYGIVWILRLSGFGHNMNFWLVPFNILTHYQTTNFRLFQTERVCGRQFQIWRKWQQVIQTGRKHCGKKEKLLVTSNFSFFPYCFQKACIPGASKGVFVWEWVKALDWLFTKRQNLRLIQIEGICRWQNNWFKN